MSIFRHTCNVTLCNIALWIGCGLSYSAAAEVSFVTKEVEYRLGESVMIPLKMDTPVAETTSLELKSQKAGIVENSGIHGSQRTFIRCDPHRHFFTWVGKVRRHYPDDLRVYPIEL